MSDRRCPSCDQAADNNVSSSGQCLGCGHDYVTSAVAPAWRRTDVDLRLVARRQRVLLWFVLALVLLNILSVLIVIPTGFTRSASAVPALLMIVVQLAALVAILQLQSAMGVHLAMRILTSVLMVAPCVNVLVLLSVNSEATKLLKTAGLRIGLLGVADEQVLRVLSPDHCTACGYIVAGNVSGTCPECGAALPA